MKCHLLILVWILSFVLKSRSSQEIRIDDNCMPNSKIQDLNSFFHPYQSGPDVTYALTESHIPNRYFEIRKDQLFSKGTIDIDVMCSQIEQCCDKDLDYCKLTVKVIVTTHEGPDIKSIVIHVADINDNAPQFKNSFQTIKLEENLKDTYSTLLPVADDVDFGRNRVETYQIGVKEQTSFDNYFSISLNKDRRWALKLDKLLDREVVSVFSFELLAIDGGTPTKKTGTTSITIEISDQNDNVPIFTKSLYKEFIKEGHFNSAPIVTLSAEDKDEGENAKIEFKLSESSIDNSAITSNFKLETNGKIYLKKPLDYEKGNLYKFSVIATNPTPFVNAISPISTATVEIEVINEHDEPVKVSIDYQQQKSWAQVRENRINAFIAFVTVKSIERGLQHDTINCRLQSFENLLGIFQKDKNDVSERSYEIKTITEIDREVYPRIETKVICTQSSTTNVTKTEAPLIVLILDENDNAPEMTVEGHQTVTENSVIGTTIFTVRAKDPDEGENGRISFSLDTSEPFNLQYLTIDQVDGKVKVHGKIDCEATHNQLTELMIVVTAKDNGKPSKSSDLTIRVKVQDVNDNIPTFYNILSPFIVYENSPKQTLIGEIEVVDKDHSDTVSLRILNPNQIYLPFIITTRDNKIFYLNSTRSIDREKHASFQFQIAAQDGTGKLAHTVYEHIEVKIMDVNDNAPMIIFPIQNNASVHRISYLEPPNHRLLLVSANDHDEQPDNNRLVFIIEDEHKIFTITNKDTYITTMREMTRADVGDKRIRIVVRDHGTPPLESSVLINIVIDQSSPKSASAQNNNRLNRAGDSSSDNVLSGNSDVVLYVVVAIIIFLILIIIVTFVYFYRRCKLGNRASYDTIFPCCPSSQSSLIVSKPMISSPTQRFDDDMLMYNNHQNAMLNGDKLTEVSNFGDSWNPEKIQVYTNSRSTYNKIAYPNIYHVNPQHPQHTYQIIEDTNLWPRNCDASMIRNSSYQIRGKNVGQCKSELNINKWGNDRNEFFSLDTTPGAPWITSQTPLPTRSRHIVNTELDTDSFDNFAVALPLDQSTFV